MIAGALAISRAEASVAEQQAWHAAMQREVDRYGLDRSELEAALRGESAPSGAAERRPWWEWVVVLAALGVFVSLAAYATRPPVAIRLEWVLVLGAGTLGLLVAASVALWRRTRFA